MNDLLAPIYEFFYYSDPFSDDIFSEGLYSPLALGGIIISFALVILFYYIINRPSFSRWYHWGIILLSTFIINFIIAMILPKNRFIARELEYFMEDYLVFAFFNAIIACLFFLIFSFLFRWWSTNAKGTPIPH